MPAKTVSVHILDKDYQVTCSEEEEEALARAALELNLRMKTIRQSGTVIGVERIAVMAALNLAHEMLNIQDREGAQSQELLEDMYQRVENILSH